MMTFVLVPSSSFDSDVLSTDSVLDPSFFHDPSGCTAVAALVTDDRIICVRCSMKFASISASNHSIGKCR